jgi:thiol-disulfide isomerase/thioredoxin
MDEMRVKIVYYGAPAWCKPCQKFEPEWDKLVDDYGDVYPFYFMDIDSMDASELYDLNVRGVPSVVVYLDDKEIGRVKPAKSELIMAEIDWVISGAVNS